MLSIILAMESSSLISCSISLVCSAAFGAAGAGAGVGFKVSDADFVANEGIFISSSAL